MIVVVPAAGRGTRLLPLTRHRPKPLLAVGTGVLLDQVLDRLAALPVERTVFVVGHLGAQIEAHVSARGLPGATFVRQPALHGQSDALACAEAHLDGPVLVVFPDMVFEADLASLAACAADGAVHARRVSDPSRFGVVVPAADGFAGRFVEKPTEPVSNLAIVGLYYVKDGLRLADALRRQLAGPPHADGEHYLADALQMLVDDGARLEIRPVLSWHDCGTAEDLLAANRHLLEHVVHSVPDRISAANRLVPPVMVAPDAEVSASVLGPFACIGPGCRVHGSTIGPHASLAAGVRVVSSRISDAVVDAGTYVELASVHGSLVGRRATVRRGEIRGCLGDGEVATSDRPPHVPLLDRRRRRAYPAVRARSRAAPSPTSARTEARMIQVHEPLRLTERVESVPPSGIRKFFDIIATMPDVISLGIGEPDFVTPGFMIEAAKASLDAGRTGYTSNSGILELRRALASHLEALYGVRYDPDSEILVTVGVSEAMHLTALALVEAGDEVLVPQPCFGAYTAVVTFAGGTPVPVATHVANDFQVDVADLERAVTPRTRGILIGYPNNPTGAVMDRSRLEDVAAFAERHGLFVMSDEIYDQLVYGITHTCFASLPGMRERTVLLGGFSKDYAMTGWRIGYACAPADVIAGLRKIHQYVIMSAPTAGQYAALAALTDPRGPQAVADMRDAYDRRRRTIVDGLNRIGLPTFEPRGAFYAFPDIRVTGLDGDTFSERLLYDHQVAVVPGEVFGEAGRGFVRCSYATDLARIERALERIEAFVRSLR